MELDKVKMALESVSNHWGHRKDMIAYWDPSNHQTKKTKSKKTERKNAVNHYDILTGPQKWMLLSEYQNWTPDSESSTKDSVDTCTVNTILPIIYKIDGVSKPSFSFHKPYTELG